MLWVLGEMSPTYSQTLDRFKCLENLILEKVSTDVYNGETVSRVIHFQSIGNAHHPLIGTIPGVEHSTLGDTSRGGSGLGAGGLITFR